MTTLDVILCRSRSLSRRQRVVYSVGVDRRTLNAKKKHKVTWKSIPEHKITFKDIEVHRGPGGMKSPHKEQKALQKGGRPKKEQKERGIVITGNHKLPVRTTQRRSGDRGGKLLAWATGSMNERKK